MAYRLSAKTAGPGSLHNAVGRRIDHLEVVRPRMAPSAPDLAVQQLLNTLSISGSDAFAPSDDATLAGLGELSSLSPAVRSSTESIEDGRSFTPSPEGIPSSRRGDASHFTVAPPQYGWLLPHGTKIRASKFVAICVRRKARRETLLAIGKGGGAHKPPRSGKNSNAWC